MSLWLLLIFALSMLAAVLAFAAATSWTTLAQLIFGITLAIFVASVLVQGIRKPVI